MKKITLLLFVICLSCAPMLDVKIQSIQEVVEADGTKNELFVKANQWMVSKFNNAESVVQFTDKESGTITGKYMLKETYTIGANYQTVRNGGIFAIINIDVRDNRARITITPEEYSTPGEGGNQQFMYLEKTAREDINTLIQDFSESINEETDKDW